MKRRAAEEIQKPSRMDFRIANDIVAILKHVLFGMGGGHLRKKFRRHQKALDVGHDLPVVYWR